jgi:hypothetical protein
MIKHASKWVLAASALSFLAPASAAVAGDQVPFLANLTIIPDPNNPDPNGPRLITGIASHLGVCTGTVSETVTPTADPLVFNFAGEFTLTAANGDEIFGTDSGTLTLNLDALPLIIFDVDEDVTFTGGTGRFLGARGSAEGTGQAIPGGPAHESFQGTISSPSSLN